MYFTFTTAIGQTFVCEHATSRAEAMRFFAQYHDGVNERNVHQRDNNGCIVGIDTISAVRRNEIAKDAAGYTYSTTFGAVGISAPYTSIVGNMPYTACVSYPHGVELLWAVGYREGINKNQP